MSHEPTHRTPAEAGVLPEALSSEVLKLKIDDLFQEIEQLKRRVARLEGQPAWPIPAEPASSQGVAAGGVVSNPDQQR